MINLSMRATIRAASALSAVAICSTSLVAQSRSPIASQRLSGADEASRLPLTFSSERRARAIVRTAAVYVSGSPKDFRVLSVPVPDTLPANVDIGYETQSVEDAPLVGSAAGFIRAGNADARSRGIRLVVGIPARARAGSAPIALMRFFTRDTDGRDPLVVEVPIELLVASRHSIEVTSLQNWHAARPGQVVTLGVRIFNAGNTVDTIRIAADLPSRWSEERRDDRVFVLPVHGTAEDTLRVRIPLGSNSGNWSVAVRATKNGQTASSTSIGVNVLDAASTARGTGPVLTLGTASAGGPWGGIATAYSMAVAGNLTDDVELSARSILAPSMSNRSAMGLGRIGYLTAPPSVGLKGRSWNVSAGPQGVAFSDLTGTNGGANAVRASVTAGSWTSQVLAGKSLSGFTAQAGSVAGAQLSKRVGATRTTVSVSHIVDHHSPGQVGRSLHAGGIGTTFAFSDATNVSAEIAYRRSPMFSGVGLSTQVSHESADRRFDLRYLNAPGGSSAFARAAQEMYANYSQRLGRSARASVSAWQTDDRSPSFAALNTRGANVSGSILLGNAVSVSVDARHNNYDAASNAASFGTSDNSLNSSVDWRFGLLQLSAGGSAGAVVRTTAIGVTAVAERAPRVSYRGGASLSTRFGTLGVDGQRESNGSGIGLPSTREAYSARLDRVSLRTIGRARLSTGASFTRVLASAPFMRQDISRGELRFDIPGGVSAVLEAERNPFFSSSLGDVSATVWTMRVEQPFRLPRLANKSTAGVVYRDLNANGRRDAQEPTVAGLAIRRGSETALTDARGRFAFKTMDSDSAAPSIDARSLPIGFVEGRTSRTGKNQFELGVTTLAPVAVHLVLAGTDSARVPNSILAAAIVIAKDSGERSWVARATTNGMHLFDGLPPGEYTIAVDLSDIEEPMRLDGKLPSIRVGAGIESQRVVVTLRTRSLRIRTIESSSPPTSEKK